MIYILMLVFSALFILDVVAGIVAYLVEKRKEEEEK